jgi:chain length determinant protein EpsF
MSFQQLLAVLRARFTTALITLLAVVGITLLLSTVLPKQYTATAYLVIDFKGMDQTTGGMLPLQLVPGYMATQVDIIQSHRVARRVVTDLKLAANPGVREQWLSDTSGRGSLEDWLADLLLKKLDVKPAKDSSVVALEYTNPDPRFASTLANAFAQAYIDTNLDLRVAPAQVTANWFEARLASMKGDLEKAQAALNAYQRRTGIVATDERADVESTRLSELSGQLVQAQAAVADGVSRLQQLDEFLARGKEPEALPEVLANPVIQGLKSQLSQSVARLEQISSQLGNNHPDVRKLKADIESQRTQLREEIRTVASSIRNVTRVAQQRESELRAAVAEQKAKLFKFNQGRDEMAVLMKEVESAQHAYEAASQRLTQTSLESQANQTNITLLSPAVTPITPSFPRLYLNLALAVVFGSMLGLAFALVREMLDQRVRRQEDVVEVVGLPVLAIIESSRSLTRPPLRQTIARILGRPRVTRPAT